MPPVANRGILGWVSGLLAATLCTAVVGAAMAPPGVAVLPLQSTTLEPGEVKWFEAAIMAAISTQTDHVAVGPTNMEARLGAGARDLLWCEDRVCLTEQAERLHLHYVVETQADRDGSELWVQLGVLNVRDRRAVRHRFVSFNHGEQAAVQVRRLVLEQLGPLPAVPDIAEFWRVHGVTEGSSTSAPFDNAPLPPDAGDLEGANLRIRTPVIASAGPRASHTAELHIRVNAPGALVSIDGDPFSPAPRTLRGAGRYNVRVEAPGHGEWANAIPVPAGADADLDVTLAPMRRHTLGGAIVYRWAERLHAVLGVAEYRLRHLSWLATRVRLGAGELSAPHRPPYARTSDVGYISLGEQIILPLLPRNEPMRLSSNWPVELSFAADLEVMASDIPYATLVGSGGLRAWWFSFAGTFGMAFDETGWAVTAGFSAGASVTF